MTRSLILVVDDHAPTREGFAALLRDCGYFVVEAAHGGEAILQVQLQPPDLVLLDIKMPVLDGIETAAWLREHVPAGRIRLIGITASAVTPELERMRALCDDVILKPCSPDEIARRIRAA